MSIAINGITIIIIKVNDTPRKKGLEDERHKEKQIKNKVNTITIKIIQITNING